MSILRKGCPLMHQKIFRAINPKLYDMIQRYRVNDDSLMPWAYQKANPDGRPYHDDWGIMTQNKFLQSIQPWQKIPRIDGAYRVPLPFKIISGEKRDPVWRMWDTNYPTSPGTPIEEREVWTPGGVFKLPHALCDEGGWGTVKYAVYLPHIDQWIECFIQTKKMVFGKRYMYYNGLKQDLTVDFHADWTQKSDLTGWFPEISVSWKKGT